MSKQLEDLIDCGEAIIEEKAKSAIEIRDLYEAGEISKDEYKELLEDLARLDEINSMKDKTVATAYLITALSVLSSAL